MDHPDITKTIATGYPFDCGEPLGNDGLGNEIFEGDEVLEFYDEVYLVGELSSDAIEILEQHGAVYKTAREED